MSSSLSNNQTVEPTTHGNEGTVLHHQPSSPHRSASPKHKSRRTFVALATAFAVLLLGGLFCLTGCLGSFPDSNQNNSPATDSAEAEEDTTTPESSDDSSSQEGLPASFTAYGNNYSVSSYSIDINEDGNTVVTCEGTGFEVLPMREGSFRMPLSCTLMEKGSAYKWQSGSTNAKSIEFEFTGELEPDTIILRAGDDDSQQVELKVE